MTRPLHIASAVLGLMLIATFWLSTATVELFGTPAQIATAKTGVLYGMILLIPSMATAGITGARLGKGWRLPQVAVKQTRMKVIAANGILILVPSAFVLARLAQSGSFGTAFYALQALELLAGALNILLMGLNMRDGLALKRRRSGAREKA